jgi:hypothetical protein
MKTKFDKLELNPVHWLEAQRLLDQLSVGRENEPGWDLVVPSPDRRYEAWYQDAGAYYPDRNYFPYPYFRVRITEKDTGAIVWQVPDRFFSIGDIAPQTPWSKDSSKLALVEWHGEPPEKTLLLLDVQTGIEKTIGSRKKNLKIQLVPSSCHAVVVEGDAEVSCWFYDDHASMVLGESEWHNRSLLVADTRMPRCLLACKQMDSPELEIVDVIRHTSLENWPLSPHIFDEIGHKADLPDNMYVLAGDKYLGERWNELLWDEENDRYLLGVRRSSGLVGETFYQIHEWLELRLHL